MQKSTTKRILITGSNGFLGRNLIDYFMNNSNHKITTLSRTNSDFNIDLSEPFARFKVNFNSVIHCAGIAHQKSKNEDEIIKTNFIGTLNLLQSLDGTKLEEFIFISTVSVYGSNNGELLDESSPLNAQDPYGRSKILAEREIISWCELHKVRYLILRLPLIIGCNPVGNLLKIKKAINRSMFFLLDNGKAKRSMILAKDVGKFIQLAKTTGGIYNLTDGRNPTYKEISNAIARSLNKRYPKSIPYSLVKPFAAIGDKCKIIPFNSKTLTKLTETLTFSNSKATDAFPTWKPQPALKFINIIND